MSCLCTQELNVDSAGPIYVQHVCRLEPGVHILDGLRINPSLEQREGHFPAIGSPDQNYSTDNRLVPADGTDPD